ncbi:MAG TPA: 4-(cytidine 5'-diphospho)-2-C-methyl-D-erythritol kinase [Stellaceae bacterium]|nr:4-(cytidine 5'-diphospho)-2-C-methyl-D-erythritol kinase [Stellaceae bacterium]
MARRWFAPAKLNLYLHVVGRRFDGFHLLDSLVAFAEIGDEISAESAPSLSLTVDGPYAAGLSDAPRDNLVWRAAELLAAHAGRPAAAALTLTKNLPIASGIGGGSSDAAAVLKALNTVWRLGLAEAELARLGAALGADVPVCVGTRAAWLGGIGDEVAPSATLPEVTALLVNPGIALPTPAVFKARQGPFSAAARFDAMPADAAGLAALLAARRNDLTNAAVGLVPVIGEVLDRLATLEGALIARMSGSGATCFALFAEAGAAATAGARLRVERPNWWVAAGRLF